MNHAIILRIYGHTPINIEDEIYNKLDYYSFIHLQA